LKKNTERKGLLLRITRAILVFGLIVGVFKSPLIARSQVRAGEMAGAMDFKACTELAVRQSPYFTKSALEIDIRRLDESDHRWSFVPYLSVNSGYALNWADGGEDNDLRRWSISFTTGSYDPLKSYFSLKASKMVSEIAILNHLRVMSEGLHQLAGKFPQLETLGKVEAYQDKLVDLARQKLTFVQKRHNLGGATLLDVQVAAKQLEVEQSAKEKLVTSRRSILKHLRFFLGIKSTEKLNIDFKEAGRQVLGPFDTKAATLEQVHSHSIKLEIHEIMKKLQKLNITLAYAKYMPEFSFNFQTRNVTQTTLDGGGYVTSLNAKLLLWDGMNRYRNVLRQKKIFKQYESDGALLKSKLGIKWEEVKSELRGAEVALKFARSSEELTRLKVRQGEISYKSNGQPLSSLLDSRIAHLKAQKETLLQVRDYELAALDLRYISGDLFDSHVKVTRWKE